MPIFIIDKLKPKNGGTFKLMDTLDISHKDYELEDFLDSLETKLNNLIDNLPDQVQSIEIQNFDGVLKWKYTNEDESAWRELIDLSNTSSAKKEVYVGDTEPIDDSVSIWVDTSKKDPDTDDNVVNIPTKVSELENDSNYISLQDLKTNLSLSVSGGNIVLKYNEDVISTIPIADIKS